MVPYSIARIQAHCGVNTLPQIVGTLDVRRLHLHIEHILKHGFCRATGSSANLPGSQHCVRGRQAILQRRVHHMVDPPFNEGEDGFQTLKRLRIFADDLRRKILLGHLAGKVLHRRHVLHGGRVDISQGFLKSTVVVFQPGSVFLHRRND